MRRERKGVTAFFKQHFQSNCIDAGGRIVKHGAGNSGFARLWQAVDAGWPQLLFPLG